MAFRKNKPRRRNRTNRSPRNGARRKPDGPRVSHLTEFKVSRYRSVGGLAIPYLTKANLLTGYNGVGKTALLEAIWLFNGRDNGSLLWNQNILRSPDPVLDPISELSAGSIELSGSENGASIRYEVSFHNILQSKPPPILNKSLGTNSTPVVGRLVTKINNRIYRRPESLHATSAGLVACRIDPTLGRAPGVIVNTAQNIEVSQHRLNRYSDLVRAGHKQELSDALRHVLGDFDEVEILTNNVGTSYISVSFKNGLQLPLRSLGGGSVKFLSLCVDFFSARNGLVLLDEMENGIHYSLLETLWNYARNWSTEWNVQLYATTHSAELIDAAIEAYNDSPRDLAIHHLIRNRDRDSVGVITYTGDSLLGAKDLELEVR